MKVADAMVARDYEDGECIIKQGDDAEYFYMVISGKVVVKRKGDDLVSFSIHFFGLNKFLHEKFQLNLF